MTFIRLALPHNFDSKNPLFNKVLQLLNGKETTSYLIQREIEAMVLQTLVQENLLQIDYLLNTDKISRKLYRLVSPYFESYEPEIKEISQIQVMEEDESVLEEDDD
jgi:hypothetical protein